jgi:hypothetical protein
MRRISIIPRFATLLAAMSLAGPFVALGGELVGWGDNRFGQIDVPAGDGFVAAAGGFGHTVPIKEDGSLVAWGMNGDGQCNVPGGNCPGDCDGDTDADQAGLGILLANWGYGT